MKRKRTHKIIQRFKIMKCDLVNIAICNFNLEIKNKIALILVFKWGVLLKINLHVHKIIKVVLKCPSVYSLLSCNTMVAFL